MKGKKPSQSMSQLFTEVFSSIQASDQYSSAWFIRRVHNNTVILALLPFGDWLLGWYFMRCWDRHSGDRILVSSEQWPPASVLWKGETSRTRRGGMCGCCAGLGLGCKHWTEKALGLELRFLIDFVGAFHVRLQVAAGLPWFCAAECLGRHFIIRREQI